MNYDDVIASLQNLAQKKGINYSLDRLNPFLESLGNPHLLLRNCIHIAGTNGKGSTVAFIKSILIGLGYSVGTYTSPHQYSYCERIAIDHTPISESDFCRLFELCLPYHSQGLTEFETLTIMSFLYFNENQPDYILYETGLGGRLDATNVINPKLCIITKIDYDHQAILGDTLEKIATEKAGIMKANVPVLTTLAQQESVLELLIEKSIEKNSPLIPVAPLDVMPYGSKLNADCQRINAALAKAAVRQVEFLSNERLLVRGIQEAYLWGRFEEKFYPNTHLILDGAHNPAGIASLAKTFKEKYPNKKPLIIVGIHQAKALNEMIQGLYEISDNLYYCQFDSNFSTPIDTVQRLFPAIKEYTLNTRLPDSEIIIFTGSLYLLGHLDLETISKL
jgi:dihydrofolate synthase/folylpolyglutamate synthase